MTDYFSAGFNIVLGIFCALAVLTITYAVVSFGIDFCIDLIKAIMSWVKQLDTNSAYIFYALLATAIFSFIIMFSRGNGYYE